MAGTIDHIVIGEKVAPPVTRALLRPRVTDRISELAERGVGYVHGAAGIGKTTLLAQLSEAWAGPVAWVRLDQGDGSEERLVALLHAALGAPIEDSSTRSVDAVIAELESPSRGSTLLVIDDLHSVDGTEGAEVVDRVLRYRPRNVTVLMASRRGLDPARRSLIGSVDPMVVDFEDLRFRLWEVDDLMRSHHEISIPPADLTLLCRYTDGWAAALRLFTVACRDADAEQRRQLISGLRTSSGMVHDYLMAEVLSSLDDDAATFLVSTSVFEHVTPARAHELLGTEDALPMLRRIQAVGMLGATTADQQTFVCHDLLRSHLLSRLRTDFGADVASELQLRAAAIAEAEDAPAEAIRYYARGGDVDAIRRILDASGAVLSSSPARWIDGLPNAIRDQDPFVLLTSGRLLVRHGDLREARSRYRRAVELFDSGHGVRRLAQLELRRIDAWLEVGTTPVTDWVSSIRRLLHDGAAPARRPVQDPDRLAGAVADVLRGDLVAATEVLASREARAAGLTAIVSGALRLLVDHLRLGPDGVSPAALRRVQQAAKRFDARAVERVVGAISRGGYRTARGDPLVDESRTSGDQLGAGLILLVDGTSLLHQGHPDPAQFDEAVVMFERGTYGELALLGRGLGAVARAANGEIPDDMAVLEAAARRSGGLVHLLLGIARAVGHEPGDGLPETIERGVRRAGLEVLVQRVLLHRAGTRSSSSAMVGVLGGFRLLVDGEEVVADLTPLHREVLAYLVVHVDEWINKDRLKEAFWPEKDEQRASRSLQVAVSRVRLELERLGMGTIERDGTRYAYRPAEDVEVDLVALRRLLTTSRDPEVDPASVMEEALRAFGEVVDDLGAVEWAIEPRRVIRQEVARRALEVARGLERCGDRAGAARIAELGVHVDPGSDELWQIAVDTAGAARARELTAAYERYVDR